MYPSASTLLGGGGTVSRGLSRLQRGILAFLRGKVPAIFHVPGGAHTTTELLREMVARGWIRSDDTPAEHRQNLFVLRRACASLVRRGLLVSEDTTASDPPHCRTISWWLPEEAWLVGVLAGPARPGSS